MNTQLNPPPKYKVGDNVSFTLVSPEVRKTSEEIIREKEEHSFQGEIVEVFFNQSQNTFMYRMRHSTTWVFESEIV